MRLHRWIVTVAGWFVPKALRTEWRAEWDAEFDDRESRQARWPDVRARPFDLARRSLGAFWDALWLQSRRWYALRLFGRHWRLATAAVLSLSVAMAATVMALAAYNAVLVRPPGVGDPASLYFIHVRTASDAFGAASFPEYEEYRARVRAFSDVAAFPHAISSITFAAGPRREQIVATHVSDDFFQVLGVEPRLGRLSLVSSALDGTNTVVVSERFWKMLGADPGLVGSRIELNDQPVFVSGVVPETFGGMTWGFAPDFWMSLKTSVSVLGNAPEDLTNRSRTWLNMVGRLRTGTSVAQAQSDAQLVAASIERDHPDTGRGRTAVLTPISVTPPGDRSWMARILGALLFVVLLTLVVACANVTNLLLGLAGSRRHEMLVRAALGASRLQLVGPMLRESLTVGLLSGVLGFGVAVVILQKLSEFRPKLGGFFPTPSFDLRPDVLVWFWTLGIALVVGLAVGLAPALRAASEGLSGSLHREAQASAPHKLRARQALVVIQMGVATVVLVAVGLSIHSLLNLRSVPLGFSARHLLYTGLDLQKSGYDAKTGPPMYRRISETLAATPGIEALTLASEAPMTGYGTDLVVAEGDPPPAGGHGIETPFSVVDDSYFSTLGMPLKAGRAFDSRDTPSRTEVIVINETLARRHWPDGQALGRRLRIENGNRLVEVIGIVPDGKYGDIDEPQLPFMFFALSQHYQSQVTVIARTSAPRETIAETLRALDSRLTLGGIGIITLDDMLGLSRLIPRLIAASTIVFGLLALFLAVFGLYSTVFYAVSQRKKEIGIRVALGARPGNLFAMVLRQSGWVALSGALAGLAGGLALLPVAAPVFYGIGSVEPAVLGAVALTTVAVTMLTSYLAIRPWMRLAAIDMLRREA